MAEAAVDHRRAVAERNAAAILDATERLLARPAPLSMAAIAAEAGVSRPTLYAHHKTLGDVIEAAVARAVHASLAAVEATEPGVGPADEAIDRMLAASWGHLAGLDALARAAAEHLPANHLHRTHAPLMAITRKLVARGQRDGVFRKDLPTDWLVTTYYSLVHGADDHARAHRLRRARALEMLTATVRDLFAARREESP
jgi:TetR/AcrR family transcriptional regulator, mexCD-oprJ operon repressor